MSRACRIRRKMLIGGPRAVVHATSRLAHFAARGSINLLFPPDCAYCHRPIPPRGRLPNVCGECRTSLISDAVRCQRCGSATKYVDEPPLDCVVCRKQRPRVDRIVPLGDYESDLRAAVLRMKHASEQHLAAAMGYLLAWRLEADFRQQRPDLVAPLPMFWSRRIRRGYSGPEVLAESIAQVFAVSMNSRLLHCRRNTRKQSMLTVSERRRNVKDAFGISLGYDIEGLRILLVDDIVTTGATANEAARILRQRGAKRITMAVLARAVSPG